MDMENRPYLSALTAQEKDALIIIISKFAGNLAPPIAVANYASPRDHPDTTHTKRHTSPYRI